MQPDKFTMKTQGALQDAQNLARERSHQEMDQEHLLLAMVRQEDSLIPPLLQKIGVNVRQLASDLEAELDRMDAPRVAKLKKDNEAELAAWDRRIADLEAKIKQNASSRPQTKTAGSH